MPACKNFQSLFYNFHCYTSFYKDRCHSMSFQVVDVSMFIIKEQHVFEGNSTLFLQPACKNIFIFKTYDLPEKQLSLDSCKYHNKLCWTYKVTLKIYGPERQ